MAQSECPWLNQDIIHYHYNRWSCKRVHDDVVVAISLVVSTRDAASITNQTETLPERNKGGRPKGTTNRSKKEFSDAIIAAKNETVVKYCEEKERNGQTNALKKNMLSNIIREVKRKRNLPDNVEMKTDHICQHVCRDNYFVTSIGLISPLALIELTIVIIIIQMARICQYISPSKGITLVNSIQGDLIKMENASQLKCTWNHWFGILERLHAETRQFYSE